MSTITMEDVLASPLNNYDLSEAEVAACLLGAEAFELSPDDMYGNEYHTYLVSLAKMRANSLAATREVIEKEWIPTMAFATFADFEVELGADEEASLVKLSDLQTNINHSYSFGERGRKLRERWQKAKGILLDVLLLENIDLT